VKYVIGFILGIVFVVSLAWMLPEQEGRYYDCSIAEWHPDVPIEVKEECRKRRHQIRDKRYETTT